MVSQEQRRKQLARDKFMRQQQRRAEARRKAVRRNTVIGAALAVAVAAVAGAFAAGAFDGGSDDTSKNEASATPTSKAPDPCGSPKPGKVKSLSFKKEPELTIDRSAAYGMKLATTCGSIGITLDAAHAPHTVNSFNFLAGKGYFDHSRCHRLTTANIYVLQCGSPTGTPEGNPGYSLPDENLKDKRLKGGVYPTGTVAVANSYDAQTGKGRNTGGSQFFLVYQDSRLPADYTPFGTISKDGLKVLKKIADAGENTGQGDGAPNATVVIDKATVARS